jgi:predicted dehydrogenase
MKDAELVAVCDASSSRLAEAARFYPTVRQFHSFDDLLNDSEVDAVVLATPAAAHFEMASAALSAGKHVIVEKPLATTVAECDALEALSARSNLTLMVGHTFLYNSAVRWLRNHIEKGDLGDVFYAYSQRLNLGRIRQDVNVIWSLAPHDVSILLYIFGDEPIAVTAHGHAYVQPQVADVGLVVLEFADGKTAHIHVSWLDPRKVRRVTVVGSSNMVVYDDVDPDARIQVYDKGIDVVPDQEAGMNREVESLGEHQMLLRSGDVLIPRLDFREPLRVQLEEFIDAIREARPPLTDVRNGRGVVRVLEAATESLTNGSARVKTA